MNKNTVIYVEGSTDKTLIVFLLKFWKFSVDEIKIEITSGYTNIENYTEDIKINNDKGVKILVIFDADSETQLDSNNGIKNKQKFLDKFKEDNKIDFDYFLFPNNKIDGTIEDFIKDISKHKNLYDCWDELWKCVDIKSNESKIEYSKSGKKSMIYYYIECLFGSSKSQQEAMKKYMKNIDFSDDKWIFNESEYAKKLKQFLDPYLK